MRKFLAIGGLLALGVGVGATTGCGGGSGGGQKGRGNAGDVIPIPLVYPPVRANTPSALIADPAYATALPITSAVTIAPSTVKWVAPLDAVNLATVVQQRLYTMGPTEILRILSEVDGRTSTLDTRPAQHPCLTGAPIPTTFALPAGQTFAVKLQCLESFGGPGGGTGGGWIAFGFDDALVSDAGAAEDAAAKETDETDGGAGGRKVPGSDDSPLPDGGALGTSGGGNTFYLVEGQSGGMGSAYRFDRVTGDVEAWISVADSRAPSNSQVLMHLLADKAAGTFELTLAGSGVGFCGAHLKTGGGFLFIDAKTNAPPPPGTAMSPDVQYCDVSRSGCFSADALDTDLGGDASACAGIARGSFGIATDLDASSDPGANVIPPTVYTYFETMPATIPAF